MNRLIDIVQELSLARHLDDVTAIVRHAARNLVGADGATFVLKDGPNCYYKDEDAIAPLWKGRRFPLETCISGWAMLNREPAVIPDIYLDDRIPHAAYRPTFVKSLVMVPIRTKNPIGAIGTYWQTERLASAEEVRLLQALADSTSVALENVQIYAELEARVQARTEELAAANERLRAEVLERERAEEVVHQISITDELTGVYNRRGFRLLAGRELAMARRHGSSAMLIFADVDGLKQVNDRNGHAEGDRLLTDTAMLLGRVFRATDVIARLGGDEFAVFCPVCENGAAETLARLRNALHEFNAAHRPQSPLALSLGGIVVVPDDLRDLDRLLADADQAMYVDKQSRRSPLRLAN